MNTKYNFTLERPDIKQQWDIEKNSYLNPYVFSNYSRRKVFWKCENGHGWKASVYERVRKGENCPECYGAKRENYSKLEDVNPKLEKQWNKVRNKSIDIEAEVVVNTKKKIWWKCEKGHEWKDKVINRTIQRDSGCPICNSLPIARPDLAKEWNITRNKISPTKFQVTSDKRVWWTCKEGHSWKERIHNRVRKTESTCPECSSFSHTHPHLLKEWNQKKNRLNPKELKATCRFNVWWKCEKGHEWEDSIANRALSSSCCPSCKE